MQNATTRLYYRRQVQEKSHCNVRQRLNFKIAWVLCHKRFDSVALTRSYYPHIPWRKQYKLGKRHYLKNEFLKIIRYDNQFLVCLWVYYNWIPPLRFKRRDRSLFYEKPSITYFSFPSLWAISQGLENALTSNSIYSSNLQWCHSNSQKPSTCANGIVHNQSKISFFEVTHYRKVSY